MQPLAFLTSAFLRHSFRGAQPTTTKRLHQRGQRIIRAMTLPPQNKFLETSFPESIGLAREVVQDLPAELSTEYKNALTALLQTSAGSRGLFVVLLSDDDTKLCDDPVHEGLKELLSNANNEEVLGVAVKNVVMSSAMVETYSARGDTELAEGSRLTSLRAINVLRIMGGIDVARRMVTGLQHEQGEFKDFSKKWGYGEREINGAVQGLVAALGEEVLKEE